MPKVKTQNQKLNAPKIKKMAQKNGHTQPQKRSPPLTGYTWIPKDVLKAQAGYNQIWVPKVPNAKKKMNYPPQSIASNQWIQPTKKQTYKSIPKLINQKKVSNAKNLTPIQPANAQPTPFQSIKSTTLLGTIQ